eukprot:3586757-Pleurochrysis_carterae.AAC.1
MRVLATERRQRGKGRRESGPDQQGGVFLCVGAEGALRERIWAMLIRLRDRRAVPARIQHRIRARRAATTRCDEPT